MDPGLNIELGLNFASIVHNEQEFVYFQPLKVGQKITCRDVVARKHTEGDRKFVDLHIHTEDEEGEKKLIGTATVRLPS